MNLTTARIASIDIGSNTVRLLIAEPLAHPPYWKRIFYTHQITRLSEGLRQTGQLSAAGIQRTLACLQAFSEHLQAHGVPSTCVRATATAAVRQAANGAMFCNTAKQETGITVHTITGDVEARLALHGACSVLHNDSANNMLLVDIGGGSTEFAQVRHGSVVQSISIPLGVVHTYESHVSHDPIQTAEFVAMQQAASQYLQDMGSAWKTSPAPVLVGTAGTVTTLAAIHLDMQNYDAERINNAKITRQSITVIKDSLMHMNHAERLHVHGIEKGREDVILAGIAILEAIMTYWNYEQLISVDAGLLEGNWLDFSQELHA